MTKGELIEPTPRDKRYARRDDEGHFTEDQADVGKSAAADQRQHSKASVPVSVSSCGCCA